MADSAVDITSGTGTSIDTRTEGTNGHHRQVVVIGDPATNAGVAAVNASLGLQVNIGTNNTVLANGGSLTAFQGGDPWLVTMPTLPVIANINNSSIAVTQSGSTPWLATLATLPVIASGSLANAGGSLSAFQGGQWSVYASLMSNTIVQVGDNGSSLTIDGSVAIGSALPAGNNNIGDVDIASIAAGDNNIGNVDAIQSGTWTVQPGNTPNTTAWLVTMATIPVVGDFSISGAVDQGNAGSSAWKVTMATLPVIANINNSSLAVTQSGTWDEVGINDSGNSITIDGNIGVIGGSLSAFQGGSWNVANVGGSISSYAFGGSLSAFNAGGSVSAFQGGSWNVWASLMSNTIIQVGDNGGSLTVDNGGTFAVQAAQSGTWTVQPGNTPNTVAWLVTMATLPVVTSVNVAGQATVTALQGDAGSSPWRVTMATMPVMANVVNSTLAVTQSGTWDEVGINDSGNSITVDGVISTAGGSLSSWAAGGSLSAFQGGAWSVANVGGSITAFQGGGWNVAGSISAYVFGGSLSAFNVGGSLSSFQGGTWTVQPGNTPNTTAWLVTMATLPVVANVNVAGQATVTALQGDPGSKAWLVTMATLPVMANIINTSIPVTQSGTWDEIGINDSGNSITIDGNVGIIGGSLSVWNAGGSLSAFNAGGSISSFNAGGSLSAFQGGTWTVQPGNTPNTVAWLVTMATLPVVTSVNVAGQATVTALQGDAGSSAWKITLATLPVMANIVNSTIAVTQSGTWDEIGINDSGNSITIDGNVGVIGGSLSAYIFGGSISAWNAGGSLSAFQGGSWTVANVGGSVSSYVFGGSLSAFNAGGSISAFQGGTWNVFSSMASGTHFIGGGQYFTSLVSLAALQHSDLKIDMFNNLMVNTNVPLPNSARFNRFLTFASMASIMAAPGSGKRLVIREFDFSGNATLSIKLVEDHAGTPATIWGPHYFLPYAGIVKPQTYMPLTANKSLGIDITGSSFNSTLDIRVETENV